MESLQREIDDLRVAYQQLQDVIEQSGGLAIPPQHMQVRVVGKYAPDFFKSGRDILDDIERVLAPHGKRLASFPAILDFGCGCGRIVAALPTRLQPGQRLFGSDIDPEAIDWCQAKYSSVAEFALSPHTPRTLYRDGQFDFVYGISIFTHLPESMQFDWLRELERITAPGGYLVLSTHGKSHLPRLPSELRAQVEDRGFGYVNFGTTEGLPEFYLTTYHSERYIRERWSEFFDVLSVDEIAIANKQDAVVCRRRWDDE
jgi:SAM-dependent methyltransferase